MRKTLFLILALFSALTCLAAPTGFAQSGGSDLSVKLIYFLPRGSTPRPDIDTKFNQVLKDTQQFFADEMERHGYGRKTFNFETDRRGNAVVRQVNGRFRDAYYLTNPWRKSLARNRRTVLIDHKLSILLLWNSSVSLLCAETVMTVMLLAGI